MADQCVLFEDLLRLAPGGRRTYELRGGTPGYTCVDAKVRRGADWWFARTWVRTVASHRELYRVLDRLEASGFRFQVEPVPERASLRASAMSIEDSQELDVRASLLLASLTPEERRIHQELFPEEHRLLAAGYDWDGRHVYRNGEALRPDLLRRLLDEEGDVLYEWVRVADELTWRRYPLERVRRDVMVRGR